MADEKDIAPELYERLLNDFDRSIADDPEITVLLEKIKAGKATYAEANEFAIRVGELLAKDFGENITMEMLPDGKMYYNIANRTVRPMLEQGHGLIADICETVQGNLNQKAGLGIKPIRPTRNDDRIHSIVNGVTSKEKYSDAARILDAPVINCMQSVVDDSIKANVDFQGKAGLYPRIKREAVGGCCQWCLDQAGTYRYPDVPKDVYRRHDNCRCTVDYDPSSGLMRGKTQNVHTKKWETPEERKERLARREITGLDLSNSRDKIEQRKLIGLDLTRKVPPKERELRAALSSQLRDKRRSDTLYDYITANSEILKDFSPERMKGFLEETGYDVKPLGQGSLRGISFEDGGGYKINFGGNGEFQYHPKKHSHHNDEYWKISSSKGVKRYDRNGNKI